MINDKRFLKCVDKKWLVYVKFVLKVSLRLVYEIESEFLFHILKC